jgi:AcrR family transcriptional regulator
MEAMFVAIEAAPRSRPTRPMLRAALIGAAMTMLESTGAEALQARSVALAAGTSTQSLYTVFGGMPGLIESMVAEGFVRFGDHISGVPETDDPVADHLSKGWAYCDWAFIHPQLYRLMFGLTGGALRPHSGLELTIGGSLANFPEGRAAVDILTRSVERIIDAGRIRTADPALVAGQFLSATHGMVLLQIAGAFGSGDEGLHVIAELAMNLFVGLGDRRAASERSLGAAITGRDAVPVSSRRTRKP